MQDPHPPEVSPAPLLQTFQHMLPSLQLPPAQVQILNAVLSGRDVLAMPPLGELRTHYYQILATLLPGVILIFSPFIERMKKELTLLELHGISATMLHSGLSDYALAAQMERIRRKHFQIIFLSPGLLERSGIRSFFITSTEISLVVVDEAHCFSMHAPGFRPTYFLIPKFLEELKRPPVLALTLPTTRQVEQDIGRALWLPHMFQSSRPPSQSSISSQASSPPARSSHPSSPMLPLVIRPVLERSNLFLAVHRPQKKVSFLLDFLRRHPQEAGIIYCSEHRLTEHLAQLLNRSGFPALAYHKGYPQAKRAAKLRAFHAGGQILVATPDPSFELDLWDIRFVVHYTLPESLDQYYQEIDRAGRDGLPAKCILLVHDQDLKLHKTRLSQAALRFEKLPEAAYEVQRQLETMLHYAYTHQCLRAYLLHYFREIPVSSVATSPSANASTPAPASASTPGAQSLPAAPHLQASHVSAPNAATTFPPGVQSLPAAPLSSPSSNANVHVWTSSPSDPHLSYELITLPARNRVLTTDELPADESLQSIRQRGRHPKNRVEKVSMQLKQAEQRHVFIRYADRESMMNRAYKYDHLRKDPWDLAAPGLRIQRFRPISIPRDVCCINCNPELLMEKERYGVNAIRERKERVKAQIALDQIDTSTLRKEQLWNAGEELYHFEDDRAAQKSGRIMAERAIEYKKVLRCSSKPDRTPVSGSVMSDALEIAHRENSLIMSASTSSIDQRVQNTKSTADMPMNPALTVPASISSIGQKLQTAKLLEEARAEISAEVRTQLLGNLKALRQKLAAEQNVPACTVFSNRTLVELCRLLPLTREECAQVYGVGAWKLAHYGDAFLSEIRRALDPRYVAEVYESVSAELTRAPGPAIGMPLAESTAYDVAHARETHDSTALCPARTAVRNQNAVSSNPAQSTWPSSVIKQHSECSSELQHPLQPHFVPDAEMLDFLEEKYLQTRTKKRIVKKEEFYLTPEEAAAFTCPDGLRAPELAQQLNALVAASAQAWHELAPVSASCTVQRASRSEAASASVQASSSMSIMQRERRTAQAATRSAQGHRRKLSGAAIERKLAELDYLEHCEVMLAGSLRSFYLPSAKGAVAGIGQSTRRSAQGREYPVAIFSADAARWIATLFVRET